MDWRIPGELLELFSVRCSAGSMWFAGFVEYLAVYTQYPEFGVEYGDIYRAELKRLHVSPMIFWANIRRAIRPLLEADADTLRALGLDVPDDFNSADIVRAAAAACARRYEYNREFAEILAPVYRREKGEGVKI